MSSPHELHFKRNAYVAIFVALYEQQFMITEEIRQNSLGDFKIYKDLAYLPANTHPNYVTEGFSGICTAGSATIHVYSRSQHIEKNDLVVILPLQLVSITDVSEDFKITFFNIDREMFSDTMSGLCRMTPDFYMYMRDKFKRTLDESYSKRFLYLCDMIDLRTRETPPEFKRESIIHLLRIFYWEIYMRYKSDKSKQSSYHFSHKENIVFRFSMLVIEHHKEHKDVAFYADKLCISPKYLTMVMRSVGGMSARDCIVEYTISEIKAMLRDATLDIKEIAMRTRFPSQSTMSRFFRKHTGMSPTEYRHQIHQLVEA